MTRGTCLFKFQLTDRFKKSHRFSIYLILSYKNRMKTSKFFTWQSWNRTSACPFKSLNLDNFICRNIMGITWHIFTCFWVSMISHTWNVDWDGIKYIDLRRIYILTMLFFPIRFIDMNFDKFLNDIL